LSRSINWTKPLFENWCVYPGTVADIPFN